MRSAGLRASPQTGGPILGCRRSGVVPLRMAGRRRALGAARDQRNRRTPGREGAAESRAGADVEEEGARDSKENARIAVGRAPMKFVIIVLALVALACAPAPHAGDEIAIVEESAVIVWDPAAKTEHFIRRATFRGKEGHDFGFLVPTP